MLAEQRRRPPPQAPGQAREAHGQARIAERAHEPVLHRLEEAAVLELRIGREVMGIDALVGRHARRDQRLGGLATRACGGPGAQLLVDPIVGGATSAEL